MAQAFVAIKLPQLRLAVSFFARQYVAACRSMLLQTRTVLLACVWLQCMLLLVDFKCAVLATTPMPHGGPEAEAASDETACSLGGQCSNVTLSQLLQEEGAALLLRSLGSSRFFLVYGRGILLPEARCLLVDLARFLMDPPLLP